MARPSERLRREDMRKLSIRKQDRDSRIEEETILDLYHALGMNN